MDFVQKETYTMEDLLAVMERLRAPDGCPWDREQTHRSIRQCFLEETYEALEAIDNDDEELLKEELGDVLFQVVFHAQLEKEKGSFSFEDVTDGVVRKMILRHPHVFGDVSVNGTGDVLRNWDAIKKSSKHQKSQTEVLQSVARTLPALMRAQKLRHKAASTEPFTAQDCLCEAGEALAGLTSLSGRTKEEQKALLGQLLFAAAGLADALGVEAEESLTRASDAFLTDFAEKENEKSKT